MNPKNLAMIVYAQRKRRDIMPEGKKDTSGRWYPTTREDAEGDGSKARPPSRAWPWSYWHRCRTLQHCRVLVDRALAGLPVPADVAKVCEVTAEVLLVETAHEAVALDASRFRSAFDCRTGRVHRMTESTV